MCIERMDLKKMGNTRDLGGFPTESGKKIRYGKLIRSGRLYKIPQSTVDKLESLNITTVVDFRIEKEREDYPCVDIKCIRQVNLPLVCTATTGITYIKSMAGNVYNESKRIKTEFGTADNYMKSVYEIILFNEDSKANLKKFFELVKNDENCILFHCNAGKDRTGIAAMLLESVLGVDEKLIIEDYSKSRQFTKTKRHAQKFGLYIVPVPRPFRQILFALMDSKPQYITDAIATLKERYGTVVNYCKQELDLTDEDIEFLKDKYLE